MILGIPAQEEIAHQPCGEPALLTIPDTDVPNERSDAARNRRALLEAAARLITEHGPAALTMDELARHAGVGKGTVYRRFGSRSGLMLALLDHSERRLQAAMISGPPPLGPGADPVDRLVAFGRAKLELIPVQGDVLMAVGPIFAEGAYAAMLDHAVMLLGQSGTPGDLLLTAQLLLAGLDAHLVLHQIREQNIPLERIADNWETVARRLTQQYTPNATADQMTARTPRFPGEHEP
ncbi:TetR/AcrR family transcriptional regulator [Nocardia sp. NPDC101769]|uniref:TetR/AcrR family transcriptional regulator n=1 Tax=Nocardia sp. NPDC101769 TaxID=3364333 RepID=UPI00381B5E30